MTTTRLNVAEPHVGVFRSRDSAREDEAARDVLAGLGILEFSDAGFGRVLAGYWVVSDSPSKSSLETPTDRCH